MHNIQVIMHCDANDMIYILTDLNIQAIAIMADADAATYLLNIKAETNAIIKHSIATTKPPSI